MPFDSTGFADETVAADLATLEKARRLLTYRIRWIKGALYTGVSPARPLQVCMMGAVQLAANGSALDHSDRSARLTRALRAHLPKARQRPLPIQYWNDRTTTEHADVLAVFDRAIADYRQRLGRD